MKYLVDANIILESLLQQEKAPESNEFLLRANTLDFFMTDFALHSIGVILFQRKKFDHFRRFIADMVTGAGMLILTLRQEDTERIIASSKQFNLDFDDAYQYAAAEKYNLQIVSFDTDFDRTERGRLTPQQVLDKLKQQ